jgi:hypothetical protein
MDDGTLKALLQLIGQQAELIGMLRRELDSVKSRVAYHDVYLKSIHDYLVAKEGVDCIRGDQLWGGRN